MTADRVLARVVLRTPRLELRPATQRDIGELLELARSGVHSADQMPFAVAWTDALGTAEGDASFVEYYRAAARAISPRQWNVLFCVRQAGAAVGVQGIESERFAELRTVSTGSWLGRPYQGRGLGTEMRAAVLELAFAGLGAERALSGAVDGNLASRRVSDKLAYREVGRSTVSPRGAEVGHADLSLSRAAWEAARCVPVEMTGVDGELRAVLGAG